MLKPIWIVRVGGICITKSNRPHFLPTTVARYDIALVHPHWSCRRASSKLHQTIIIVRRKVVVIRVWDEPVNSNRFRGLKEKKIV